VRVVIAREDEELVRALDAPRGESIDVAIHTVDDFRAHALPGSDKEWDRYTFTHGQVLVDKLDGEIQRLVDEKARLRSYEAQPLARAALGSYLNSLYRSLKSARLGLALAARLHAAESAGHLLAALFALESRVRPFHDSLAWELEAEPLEGWGTDELLARVAAILDGATEPQQALFREVERQVRAHGLGGEIGAWEPDVALMRGER
jgi:hypothetical protein